MSHKGADKYWDGVYDFCFDEGYTARQRGMGVGTNPYDPESETVQYEAWTDGWSDHETN